MIAAQRLSREDRRKAFITRATLPDGRRTGGILVEEGRDPAVFWVHGRSAVEPDDVLRFPDGRAARVISRNYPPEADDRTRLVLEEVETGG